MLYCKRCGINIESDRSHCPLCGKCVSEENIKSRRKNEFYPDYQKWRRERMNTAAILTIILTALNALWLILELIIFKKLYYTWIILFGSFAVFTLAIWPIANKKSFSTKNVVSAIILCGFIYFLETYTKTQGWGIGIVIPVVLCLNSITIFCVMMARGYYKRSKMIPCFFIALIETAAFCICLFTLYPSVSGAWLNITSLCLCWLLTILLFSVRYKKIVNGLKKDFHF